METNKEKEQHFYLIPNDKNNQQLFKQTLAIVNHKISFTIFISGCQMHLVPQTSSEIMLKRVESAAVRVSFGTQKSFVGCRRGLATQLICPIRRFRFESKNERLTYTGEINRCRMVRGCFFFITVLSKRWFERFVPVNQELWMRPKEMIN